LQAELSEWPIPPRQTIDQAKRVREVSDRFGGGEPARRVLRRNAKEANRALPFAASLEMERELGGDLV
jgi:hypothetical protein